VSLCQCVIEFLDICSGSLFGDQGYRTHDMHVLVDLASQGYLLLRGVLDRDRIARARDVVLRTLHDDWKMIDDSKDVSKAYIKDPKQSKGVLLTGYRPVTHHDDVLALLECQALVDLFRRLFDAPPATFDNKWVRVHGTGEFTDEHTDFYRFQGTASGMCTCWMPLNDYTVADGTLAVCEGSHHLSDADTGEYGVDFKTELPPSFDEFNTDAVWRSTDFRAGDLVIFDIRLVHASTVNTSDRFRLSMDTRWQPASAVDPGCVDQFRVFKA